MHSGFLRWVGIGISCWSGVVCGDDSPVLRSTSDTRTRPEIIWSTTLDARLAPAFQLSLGGFFDPGPSVQTRWSHAVSNLFREHDKLTVAGFQAVSVPTGHLNWHAGIFYQRRLAQTGPWIWDLAGGVERWRFPSALQGTQDWAAAWTLSTRKPGRHVTWTAMVDGRNNFISNVPRGTLVVTAVTATHVLWRGEKTLLALQHGPIYAHSWNLYGRQGPRVFRYSGAVSWSTPKWSIEAGIRPQAGLSPGVPHYCYWSFGVSYHYSQRIRRSGQLAGD